MHVAELTLTSATVERSASLWPDRAAYSSSELEQALRVLRQLFAMRCAHGSILTVNGVPRACGLTAFVHADVLDAAIADPMPLLAKRLLLWETTAPHRLPFLDETDIARGNAREGLHLLIMQAHFDAGTGHADILLGTLTRAFYRLHDGYRLVRIVADYVGEVSVGVARAGEFDIIREFPSVAPGLDVPSALVVLTPEGAAARGSTIIQAFVYNPPRILFTAREQELLRCALEGAPDDIVAERLGMTLSSVKARWTRVQQRAMTMVPELFHSVPLPKQANRRGAQTRHLLLEYVRANPSELTPYLRDTARAVPQFATAGTAFAAGREESALDAASDHAHQDAAPSGSDPHDAGSRGRARR